MLANVLTKSTSDRTIAILVGTGTIALMLLAGMAVYRDIDVSIYDALPPAMRELMGIPEGADAASLAFGAIYSLMGAFTLAGLAISIGASSIAGEERDGTMGLLLGNPLSRRGVLSSKAGALVLLAAVGTAVLWLAAYVVPAILSVEMGAMAVEALMLHMFANTLFYGAMAMAISAWTGNRAAASGATIAVMVTGYLASGILPLIEEADGWELLAPWYYFEGSTPVVNGVDWGHLSVLGGGVLVFLAVAFVGVQRRDLRSRSTRRTVFDRLRDNPRTAAVMERIAGGARVQSVLTKTLSDHQAIMVVTSMVMFYMGLIMGPIYAFIPEATWEAFASFPDVLMAMIGGTDFSTPAGFFQAEIFAITAPIAIGVLTIVMGAKGLAGEEKDRTMGLLLATPITRRRVLVEKFGAMVIHTIIFGVATFFGTWIGVLISGVDLGVGGILAATALLVLFGLLLGAVALLLSAATGRTGIATYGAIGVGVLSYFAWSFLPINERLADWAQLSPFHYFLGSDPLTEGMAWGDAGVLIGLTLLLVALAVPLFDRRDLHR
ncbi:MAG: ABC transporter permease subunit [Acidimicrobiia bacterium]|nr:ABC transporter permease subunit [Acidimicrobiia bacterium]